MIVIAFKPTGLVLELGEDTKEILPVLDMSVTNPSHRNTREAVGWNSTEWYVDGNRTQGWRPERCS